MKNFLLLVVFSILSTFTFYTTSYAQCPNDNAFFTALNPTCPGSANTTCIFAGEYVTVDVVAGTTYIFSTVGQTTVDTEITVYDQNGIPVAYNDDEAGGTSQSEAGWVATFTGTVSVLVDQFPCTDGTDCIGLTVTCGGIVNPGGNGCNTDITICTPGVAGPFSFGEPGQNVSSCLDFLGDNYAYITLYITQSGPLNVLINGDTGNGFLDVSIFNVPNGDAPCDAMNNPANELACNYATELSGCNQIGNAFPCPSVLVDPITLQPVIPNVNAGDVIIILVENWSQQAAGGTTGSNSFTLELGPAPAAQTGPPDATITQVGPFCQTDAAVQLEAVNTGGTWSGPGVNADGLFDPALAGPGTHTISYTIGSAPCESADDVTIVVNPTPMITGGSDITICDGESVTITITGTTGATYAWSPATGLNTTVGDEVIATPTATTTYTVTSSLNGCQDSDDLTIFVLPAGDPLCSLPCLITNFEADANLPNCGDEYTTIGIIEFTDAPPTGTLLVEDCQGNQVVAATAPFTSPVNYTLTGTDADGQPCFFRAFFSDLTTCDSQVDFTFPAANGGDEAGTADAVILGNGINEFVLCDSDTIVVFSNGDYDIAPLDPDDTVGVGFLLYSCPPQPGGVGIDPGSDPCLVGFFTDEIFGLVNDGGDNATIFTIFPNLPPNNTFYIVPLSFVDAPNATYQEDCYDLAIDQMMTVQFLNPIVPTFTQDCATGEVQITATGGYPQFNGGNYTLSNLSPANATITVPAAPIGGTMIIGGLVDGDSWSVDLQDANGCPITVTGTFVGGGDASFTYAQAAYCANEANPTPVITGDAGGTFTAPAGISINATTGEIDLAASTPGQYTITYTTAAIDCQATATFDITINEVPSLTTTSQEVCAGEAVSEVIFTSTPVGSTFEWTNSNTSIGLGASGTGTIASFVGVNTGTTSQVGSISVTPTLNGCVGTSSIFTLTVNPLPTPVLTGGTEYCVGSSVVIGTSQVFDTYAWSTGGVGSSINATVADNPISVTVTNALGCTGTSAEITVSEVAFITFNSTVDICPGGSSVIHGISQTTAGVYSETFVSASGCDSISNVTLNILPAPVITTNPDFTVCVGDEVILVGNGGLTYAWDNGVQDNVGFFPTQTQTYTVIGTDANGCINTASVTVTINQAPLIDAGANQLICLGEQVTLSGNGGTTYTWDNGVADGVPFSPQTTTTYTVTGFDAIGCQNTDQVTVTVNPLPQVNAGPDQSVCPGDLVILNATPIGLTYTWNNGVVDGQAFDPIQTTTYTVTGTDANGCSNTDQITVTVNAAAVISAGADITVCEGNQVTLTATGGTNYVWTNGVQNGVAFTPLTSGTYTVAGTTAAGCAGSDDVLVTVETTPVVNFVPDVTSGCSPLTVTFTNTSPVLGTNCTWSFGNGLNGTSCAGGSTVYTAPGCYDVTLISTSAAGCVGQFTMQDAICISPDPVAEFTPSPGLLSESNSTSTMVNSSTNAIAYSWNFGDGTANSTEVNPNHTFMPNFEGYLVTLIAINEFGCTDTAYQNILFEEELIYYVPNTFTPDGDQFNQEFKPVFTSGFDPYDYNMKIYDRWGELIFESNDSEVGWNGSYGAVADRVQDGTYVWKIEFKTSKNDARKVIVGHVVVLR
jgi:gliding motility-associated-like protein